jgi:hypothetical protein
MLLFGSHVVLVINRISLMYYASARQILFELEVFCIIQTYSVSALEEEGAWGLREIGHGVFGGLWMLLFGSPVILHEFCISFMYYLSARQILYHVNIFCINQMYSVSALGVGGGA